MRKKLLTAKQATEIEGSLLDVIIKTNELVISPNLSPEERKKLELIREITQKCLTTLSDSAESNSEIWKSTIQIFLKEMTKVLVENASELSTEQIAEFFNQLFTK